MLIGCIGVRHGDQLLAEDLGVKANRPATLSRWPVSHARAGGKGRRRVGERARAGGARVSTDL
jgi:hypothetical protein